MWESDLRHQGADKVQGYPALYNRAGYGKALLFGRERLCF